MKAFLPYIVIFLSGFVFLNDLHAQGEFDPQERILYRNERTYGAFLNSNGIGVDFSFAKRINARNHTLYQGEFLYLQHPKEIKLSNSFYSNKSFVFGKTHSFFELRGQYGRMSELFRKNDAGGLSIRYFYSIGPTIGFLKPVYYEIIYLTGAPDEYFTRTEKFSPSVHQSSILGRASFFEGVDEISIVPGASVKVGMTFEYSRQDKKINAIEVGAGLDVFPKDIPIMATEKNSFYFLNLFAGVRFGKAIDISDAALAKRQSFFDRLKEQREIRKIDRQQSRATRNQEEF